MPTEVLVDEVVAKIVAEGPDGSFGMKPRHVDFVSGLVPGLMSYELENGTERFLAVGEGLLVKRGDEVLVSVLEAVRGEDLESLERTVEEEFLSLSEREKKARTALARLEADLVRRFYEFGKRKS
jgi:F-type H+-transporting ATPase subunit epsilon